MLWWPDVVRRSFRRESTYLGAALAGVITQVVFGAIKASIMLAVYRDRETIGGWTLSMALTWVFATQALIYALDVFGRGPEIGERIRTGDLSLDLYRPVDFQAYWLAMDIGRAGFGLLTRGVPIVVLGFLTVKMVVPSSAGALILATASIGLALVVSFGTRFLTQLTALWLMDARGAQYAVGFVNQFLGGLLLPIVFFPDWLGRLARLTPFPSILQVPIEVILGSTSGSVGSALAQQAMWAIGLLALGRVVLHAGRQKVAVQGG